MHDRLSQRQLYALVITAATGPIFWFCVRWSWMWTALGSGLAGLLLGMLYRFLPVHEKTSRTGFGRGVRMGLALGMLLLAVWAAGQTTKAFPETAGQPAAALLILAAAAWAAEDGGTVPGRCAGILLWVLLALYGTVLLFGLPQLKLSRLAPSGEPGDALRCFGILLLPAAGLPLREKAVPRRPKSPWALGGMVLLATAASAVTGGILSPALAREENSFLNLARSVSILGVIQRVEALVSGALVISGFCLCSLLLASVGELLHEQLGRTAGKKAYRLAMLPALAAVWLKPDWLGLAGAAFAICCGLLRLLQLSVGTRKK